MQKGNFSFIISNSNLHFSPPLVENEMLGKKEWGQYAMWLTMLRKHAYTFWVRGRGRWFQEAEGRDWREWGNAAKLTWRCAIKSTAVDIRLDSARNSEEHAECCLNCLLKAGTWRHLSIIDFPTDCPPFPLRTQDLYSARVWGCRDGKHKLCKWEWWWEGLVLLSFLRSQLLGLWHRMSAIGSMPMPHSGGQHPELSRCDSKTCLSRQSL